MPEITVKMAENAYRISMDVYEGRINFMEGVRILKEEYHLKSASIYINNLAKYRTGEVYKRIISKRDTKYFLNKIRQDYGTNGLVKALSAVKNHIEYLEEQKMGNRKALKIIYNEFLEEV